MFATIRLTRQISWILSPENLLRGTPSAGVCYALSGSLLICRARALRAVEQLLKRRGTVYLRAHHSEVQCNGVILKNGKDQFWHKREEGRGRR